MIRHSMLLVLCACAVPKTIETPDVITSPSDVIITSRAVPGWITYEQTRRQEADLYRLFAEVEGITDDKVYGCLQGLRVFIEPGQRVQRTIHKDYVLGFTECAFSEGHPIVPRVVIAQYGNCSWQHAVYEHELVHVVLWCRRMDAEHDAKIWERINARRPQKCRSD